MPSVADFLERAGWGDADQAPLAGDASSRRYLRLTASDGRRVLLMIDPSDDRHATTAFLAVSEMLKTNAFSTPSILSEAVEDGFILLEDFSDTLLAREIDTDPKRAPVLYDGAADAMADLQSTPIHPALPQPTVPDLADMVAPGLSWYVNGTDTPHDETPHVIQALARLLDPICNTRVFCHRDYHSENLFWLPNRQGIAKIGMIDFQDAFAGPRSYDLASLVTDARRDIAPDLRVRAVARFAAHLGVEATELDHEVAILSIQRNLRILGIFARLSRAHGKPNYLGFLPRVWGYLQNDLRKDAAAPLRAALDDILPAPSQAHLEMLGTS